MTGWNWEEMSVGFGEVRGKGEKRRYGRKRSR